MIKTSEDFFKKIYLSLYLKGLWVRGSWRSNRTAIYWPPLLWPSALCLSRSPGLLNRRPGGPLFWVQASSTASCHQWVSKLTDFLSSPSYMIVQSPTQYLEWHVWSSSSGNNCHAIHRSLSSGASVYDCTMGFYLVPYCQPSPPTRFLPITAIGMCHFHRLWNGMFGRVEGQYTTCVFVWVLWHINLCRLFNAKSIFIQINSSISNNSVCQKHFYFKLFSLVKQF